MPLASSPKDSLQLASQLTIAVYTATQLSLLILVSAVDAATVRSLSIASTGLGFTAGLFMIAVSFLEHGRSRRTSSLLNLYLLLTLIFDIVQARTLWLAIHKPLEGVFARVFTTSVCVKVVVLILEAHNKERWISWNNAEHSPEETSGVFSLAVLYWLKQLFLRGFRRILRFDDLYSLDHALSAEVTTAKLVKALGDTRKDREKTSLVKALFVAFKWNFLMPVYPQVALIGFQFSQSFFLLALIRCVALGGDAPRNQGYGLIGACVLIYVGIATSTSYYGYYRQRAVCMVRACLCTAIYKKTTELTTTAAANGAPVTLMSNDVQNVELGVQDMHLMWSSMIKVGLGSALLYTKIGVPFVTPIIIIVLCTVLLFGVMTLAQARQAGWMKQIETRVDLTANAIANMKYYKMLGISEFVAKRIHDLRLDEIQAGTKFRYILLAAFVLSYVPTTASPVITFAFTSKEIDAATLFVSLSFISLTVAPLSDLFQGMPTIIAAFTSLNRIEAYLAGEPRQDFRLREGEQLLQDPDPDDLQTSLKSTTPLEPAFAISDGFFGWDDKSVLKDINVTIPQGQLCMVIGPIASGKTTLCRVLLGEIPMASGITRISYPGSSISYCAQSPFLSDATLMENIVGFSQFNQKKYDDIIYATMLHIDVQMLPQGHNTKIGSNGIILSGGQKQRVSLARALYAESEVMIFDDVLSGLDATTESEVFSRVFGSHGILRKRGATAIICTHSVRHIPKADHIIVLGTEGTIIEQGPFDVLATSGKYVSDLGLLTNQTAAGREGETEHASAASSPQTIAIAKDDADDLGRPTGDWTVYMHYLHNISKVSSISFGLLCVVAGGSTNFSTVWVSYWSENTFHRSRSFYVGLYGLISAVQVLSTAIGAKIGMINIVASSAKNLHKTAITTVVKAPLTLFTSTDTGTITNLFSQDTMLIDGELPLAFINTGASVANLLGNFFVVAIASPYLAISYPFILGILYGFQMFYLRTSRQLRLLDLEAKSPL